MTNQAKKQEHSYCFPKKIFSVHSLKTDLHFHCCINNFFGLPFTLSCCHCHVVIFMCFSASAPDGCCHKSPIPTHTFSTYIKAQRQWEVDHMPGNVTVLMSSYLCMLIMKYDIHNHHGFTFTPGYFMA